MERPTRRSATGASAALPGGARDSHSSSSNGSSAAGSSSRRRRRDPENDKASASDGAETDSSSLAPEVSSSTRSHAKSHKKGGGGGISGKGRAPPRGRGEDGDAEDAATDAHGSVAEQEDVDPAADASESHANGTTEERAAPEEGDGAEEEEEGEEEEEEEEAQTHMAYATRAKRERSQSVVSTTSDTSSIVSEPPDDERLALHDEKLQELEKKKKMVEDGTLAEYCRRVAEFKEERNRLLQTAEWHKNLQLKNTEDLFGFEVQRAQNIWQDAKDELKSAMLAKTDALLLQLQRELAHLEATGALPKKAPERPPLRKLPKLVKAVIKPSIAPPTEPTPGASAEEEVVAADAVADGDAQPAVENGDADNAATAVKRRKVSAPVPDHMLRLPLDDITADLAGIVQARDLASSKLHATLPAPRLDLQIDRRRLLCGKYVFEEGDEVVVTSAVIKEDYIGVISSVTDDELYVKLSTGQKVRVLVEHIAVRRCEIRPFLRGSAGIESLQSTGWVECEPF